MHLKKICRRDADGNKMLGRYTHIVPMNKTKTFAERWNPSTRFVQMGVSEGWLLQDNDADTLTFVTAEGENNVVYNVIRGPLEKDANGQLVVRPDKPGHVLRANQFICEKAA